MVNKEIVTKDFKTSMQQLYGDRLAKVILFGSYARGDYHEDSDIDFMVVLKDEEVFSGKEIDVIVEKLNGYMIENSVDISTVPVSLKRYLTSDLLFYKLVRKEGIEV